MPDGNLRIIPHGSRQYAARIPAQAWDEHKNFLIHLENQGYSKSHMIRILQEYGFNPTVHQLTRKLIEWNSESSIQDTGNAVHSGPEHTSPDTDPDSDPSHSPNTPDIDLVEASPTAWNIHRASSPPITSVFPIRYTDTLYEPAFFIVDTYNVASQVPTAKSSKSLGKPSTISSASVYSCESQETTSFRRYAKELKRGSRGKVQTTNQSSWTTDPTDKVSHDSHLFDMNFLASVGQFADFSEYELMKFED